MVKKEKVLLHYWRVKFVTENEIKDSSLKPTRISGRESPAVFPPPTLNTHTFKCVVFVVTEQDIQRPDNTAECIKSILLKSRMGDEPITENQEKKKKKKKEKEETKERSPEKLYYATTINYQIHSVFLHYSNTNNTNQVI